MRFDIKRAVGYHNIISQINSNIGALHKDILLFEIDGIMDTIIINLGQRDLSTLLAVWSDNLTEGQYVGEFYKSYCSRL